MSKIEHSIEVRSTKDTLWKIISDLENEPEYWYGTKEVRTMSSEGNSVTREITQNFRNHKILQKVELHPSESVETHYIKGLTEGLKVVCIRSISDDVQRLTAFWDVRFTGIFRLATPFITRHVNRGTRDALWRIKVAAEAVDSQREISRSV